MPQLSYLKARYAKLQRCFSVAHFSKFILLHGVIETISRLSDSLPRQEGAKVGMHQTHSVILSKMNKVRSLESTPAVKLLILRNIKSVTTPKYKAEASTNISPRLWPQLAIHSPQLGNKNNCALTTVSFDARTMAQNLANFKPRTQPGSGGMHAAADFSCGPDTLVQPLHTISEIRRITE